MDKKTTISDATGRPKASSKIVVINDDSVCLERIEAPIRACYKDFIELRLFQDGRDAWQELLRGDPVFLITSDKMPGTSGEEICQRLLARGATFPIIVTSDWPPTAQWVSECKSRGLNVDLLTMPFHAETLRQVLLSHLIIANPPYGDSSTAKLTALTPPSRQGNLPP